MLKNKLMASRRAAGLCVQCGKVQTPKWRCKDCVANHNATLKRRRKARHDAGLCTFCDSPAVGKRLCDFHRDRVNKGKRRYYFQKTMQAESQ